MLFRSPKAKPVPLNAIVKAIDGDNMKTAINRADRVLRAAIECNDENPSTYVHKLVEQLLEMRHKNRGSLNSQRLKPI